MYLWPDRTGLTGKKPKTKMERPILWITTAAIVNNVRFAQVIEDIYDTMKL